MIKISLKAARVNSGLGILDAAPKIGVGKDTLIKWERNPELVSPIFQKKISEVFFWNITRIKFYKRKVVTETYAKTNQKRAEGESLKTSTAPYALSNQ